MNITAGSKSVSMRHLHTCMVVCTHVFDSRCFLFFEFESGNEDRVRVSWFFHRLFFETVGYFSSESLCLKLERGRFILRAVKCNLPFVAEFPVSLVFS